MKTSAAIALIVCGTVLILVPHIASVIGTAQVAHLIEDGKSDVSLNGGLNPAYMTWTIVAGILMIISGVAGALKAKS
jgi:TRAP-type mannitol/chloroaromatic compound transport system permease small subunit